MKIINLISFYFKPDYMYRHKDDLSFIKKNLCLHIDNMEMFGWNKDNFILKTNFDFEYKGIINTPFIYNECINLFLTKIVAAYEVLSEYPDIILWQHDHDTYQIRPFDIEKLNQEIIADINMCKYWSTNNKPQSASVFYKGMSKSIHDMYEYIQIPNPQFLNNIRYTDEETFMYFQNLGYSINTNLSFEYNTSLTKFTSHRRKTDDPYCVHGNALSTRWDSRNYHSYLRKSSFQKKQI
jgi:hypothetical protein